uniref:BZIP domain-containing protein n=1 Tax=Kalanchoe fedtschenkoi TaxID=63787 RepID=A0A7N0TZF9_KALFE
MFGGDRCGGFFPDINCMSITPARTSNHRRAQSESFLQFPDDLFLDPDLDLFDSPPTIPSPPVGVEVKPEPNPYARQRSLSVDDDFFDNLGLSNTGMMEGEGKQVVLGDADDDDEGDIKTHRRRHSFSVDGSVFEADSGFDGVKKAMAADKLAQLALIDPKRAKRILANRHSAARSKERKIKYTSELERKVHTLQTEATTLSAQVTMLQSDTNGLTAENKELKLRLQAMEQQSHLREALNEALRNEVHRLKIETGQIPTSNGHTFSSRLPLQYPSQASSHFYGSHQAQQNHPQTQQSRTNTNSNNQIPDRSVQSSFMDYSN